MLLNNYIKNSKYCFVYFIVLCAFILKFMTLSNYPLMIDEAIYMVDAIRFSNSPLYFYENTLNFKPILSIIPYYFSILFDNNYFALHGLVFVVDTISAILIYFICTELLKLTRYQNNYFLYLLVSITYLYLVSKDVIGVASGQVEHFSNFYLIIFIYAVVYKKKNFFWYLIPLLFLTHSKQNYFLLMFVIPFLHLDLNIKQRILLIFIPSFLMVLNLFLPNAFENIVNFAFNYAQYQNEVMGYFRKIRNFIHFPFSNISYALVPLFMYAFLTNIKNVKIIVLNIISQKELKNIFLIGLAVYFSLFTSSIWQQHRMGLAFFISFSVVVLLFFYSRHILEKNIVKAYILLLSIISIHSIYQNYSFVTNNQYWKDEIRISSSINSQLISEVNTLNPKNILLFGKLFSDLIFFTNTNPATSNFQYDHVPLIKKNDKLQEKLLSQINNELPDVILFYGNETYFNDENKVEFNNLINDRYVYHKSIDKFKIYTKVKSKKV